MKDITKINIKSPVFNPLLITLDREIKRVLEKIYDEEFASGEITVKLDLSLIEDSKEYPKADELGFGEAEIYYYRKPLFKHSISTSLKKQYKQQGVYVEDKEIQLIDGEYTLTAVKDPQLTVEDFLK